MNLQANTNGFIHDDARRAVDVLGKGGIARLPMDLGYSLLGGSREALRRIFETKGRAASTLNAMVGDQALAEELFRLSPAGHRVLETITVDYGLPLGAIGPADMTHPFVAQLDADTREGSTKDDTVVLLMQAGPFHAALCRAAREAGAALIGSSANQSNQGPKFRFADIEPEILEIADLVIDHGPRKFRMYGASSTLLNVATFDVVRHCACFGVITDVVKRHFAVDLTPAPNGSVVDQALEQFGRDVT